LGCPLQKVVLPAVAPDCFKIFGREPVDRSVALIHGELKRLGYSGYFHPEAYFEKAEASILTQSVHNLEISTRGQGFYEFTSTVSEWVKRQKMQVALLTIFCRHTSASLLIQENADPTVRRDIKSYFDRLAPENGPYDHNSEGPDHMPAHLKTALTQVQLSIPVVNGNLVLGTWQGIYLFEHRAHAHRREIVLHLIGE
jgi:secondary thiamine-phosphate synthase enzyme